MATGLFFALLVVTSTNAAAAQHERVVVLTDDEGNVNWDPVYTGERRQYIDLVDGGFRFVPQNDSVAISVGVASTHELSPRPSTETAWCNFSGKGYVENEGNQQEQGRFTVRWNWTGSADREDASASWSQVTGTGVGSAVRYDVDFELVVDGPGYFVFWMDRQFLLGLFDYLEDFSAYCAMYEPIGPQSLYGPGGDNSAYGQGQYRVDTLQPGAAGASNNSRSDDSVEQNPPENSTAEGAKSPSSGFPMFAAALASVIALVWRRRHR